MPASALEKADAGAGGRTITVDAYTRYGPEAASTRQRLLQYIPALEAAGIKVKFEALLGDDYVRSLADGRSFSRVDVLRSYLKRMRALLSRPPADILWVYAELFPYLPGWFERLAFRARRAIVYDLDDAFFHTYDASGNPAVRALLGRKFEPLLRRASACSCGNAYVRDYAARFCRESIIIPTVVDTDVYRPRTSAGDANRPLVVGWIGSPSTWDYLRPILPILAELSRDRRVRVRVVGAGVRAGKDAFPGLDLVDWSEDREVADVQAMDIGIMPVPDEIWARGKSGYKLIQYMACGLPVVASPVGVNQEIVTHGVTGFLATTGEEWRVLLNRLIDDHDLRLRLGRAGRERAEEEYSLAVHLPRLVDLLRRVAGD